MQDTGYILDQPVRGRQARHESQNLRLMTKQRGQMCISIYNSSESSGGVTLTLVFDPFREWHQNKTRCPHYSLLMKLRWQRGRPWLTLVPAPTHPGGSVREQQLTKQRVGGW